MLLVMVKLMIMIKNFVINFLWSVLNNITMTAVFASH